MIDFSAIRAASDAVASVPISVPGIPSGLFVRQMSIGERCELEASANDESEGTNRALEFRLGILRRCVVNEAGELIFKTVPESQLTEIGSGITEPLVDAAIKLNGFTRRDQEDLEKK